MKLWIARNEDNSLFMYREKPVLYNLKWRNGYAYGKHCFGLPENVFPEVTFENSPMEVEIKLVNNVKNYYNMEDIKNKLNEILSLYEKDENRFGGYTAIERFHESASEDYIESRTDWNTLKNYADDMYYMLSDIKTIIEQCKELL